MAKRDLTPKQEAFVREYLIDLNATQAAIRSGYSAKTAVQQGARLLTYVDIAAAIQEAMDKRAEKTELTAEYVLNGIKAVTEDAVADNDRKNALKGYELMGKHLKLFTDKQEISVPEDLSIVVKYGKD